MPPRGSSNAQKAKQPKPSKGSAVPGTQEEAELNTPRRSKGKSAELKPAAEAEDPEQDDEEGDEEEGNKEGNEEGNVEDENIDAGGNDDHSPAHELNRMHVSFPGGEAKVDSGTKDLAEMRKSTSRKNQFHKNKATAVNHWTEYGGSRDIITAEAKARQIEDNDPSKKFLYYFNIAAKKHFGLLPHAEQQSWANKAKASAAPPSKWE